MTWEEDAGSVYVVTLPAPAHAGQHNLRECLSATKCGAVITGDALQLRPTVTLCYCFEFGPNSQITLTWKSGLWLGQAWHDHWGQQGASTHWTSGLWTHWEPWGQTRSQASGPHWPGGAGSMGRPHDGHQICYLNLEILSMSSQLGDKSKTR